MIAWRVLGWLRGAEQSVDDHVHQGSQSRTRSDLMDRRIAKKFVTPSPGALSMSPAVVNEHVLDDMMP